MSKKSEILNKKRKIQAQRLKARNQGNEEIKGFIALTIFFLSVSVCQIIGMVFDINLLIYLIKTPTSTRIGLPPILISLIVSYIVIIILEKSAYLPTLIEGAKKLSQRLRKYPRLYRIAKLVYKHPIWSYFIATIAYTIIEIFYIYVIEV